MRLASDFIQTVEECVIVNRFNRIVQDITDSLQSKTENVNDNRVVAEHPFSGKSQKMSQIMEMCLLNRGDKYGVHE